MIRTGTISGWVAGSGAGLAALVAGSGCHGGCTACGGCLGAGILVAVLAAAGRLRTRKSGKEEIWNG